MFGSVPVFCPRHWQQLRVHSAAAPLLLPCEAPLAPIYQWQPDFVHVAFVLVLLQLSVVEIAPQ